MIEYRNPALPIGVFDSGIGGLTVLSALMRRLPHEQFIYFGDTARVPYGSKSPATVNEFSLQIGCWLALQPVKAVVVACNTASATALPALHERLPVPVFGVIQPGAAAAVTTGHPTIGVLATRGTIASNAYQFAIQRIQPNATVIAQASPLLVPLIEEGELESAIAEAVVEKYLQPLRECSVDTLLLGCTHYPLLIPLLRKLMPDVAIVDSAEATASVVAAELTARRIAQTEPMSDHNSIYKIHLTDTGGGFIEIAERFLGMQIGAANHVSIELLEQSLARFIRKVR